MFKKIALAAALGAVAFSPAANAGTATTTMTVNATITGACTISASTILDFGSIVATNVAVTPGTGTLSVNCTTTLPYDISMDDGVNTSGLGIHNRRMKDNAATPNYLTYQIYTDAARSIIWGTAVGVDVKSGIGIGAASPITVFGAVLVQTTPPANVVPYADTLTATITF